MRLTASPAGLLALVLATVLWPLTPPRAEGGPLAALYETAETALITGKKPSKASREATAALVGWVEKGAAICPDFLGMDVCNLTVFASDDISLTTGVGPVVGKFWVVVEGPGEVDGAEFAIAEGVLKGKIDLSAAVLGGVPTGTISARWKASGIRGGPLEGLRADGTIEGTFYLPFVDGTCHPTGYAYLDRCVEPGELSVGMTPTVRLDLEFSE